jgi:hypothetical protein
MPATSAKQKRFMQAVSNNPAFAKKVNVPQSVGKEFSESKGGPVKESKAMVGKELSFMKKKGAPKSMVKHEMMEAGMKPSRIKKFAKGGGIESKGKTRGKMC